MIQYPMIVLGLRFEPSGTFDGWPLWEHGTPSTLWCELLQRPDGWMVAGSFWLDHTPGAQSYPTPEAAVFAFAVAQVEDANRTIAQWWPVIESVPRDEWGQE